MAPTSVDVLPDEDDAFFLEDIDLADETELRRLIGLVDELLGVRRGVRVSVLSAEQWQTAVERIVPAGLRRGLIPHLHVLRDPRDPDHLLVGPSALSGLNEHSRQITAEVAYAVIRAGQISLTPLFDHGSADLLAAQLARRIELSFFTSNYPAEARLVRALISTLRAEYGFSENDWVILLRSKPERFFLALRRSQFMTFLLSCARARPQIQALIAAAPRKRAALVALLRAPERDPEDVVAVFYSRCLDEFARRGGPQAENESANA